MYTFDAIVNSNHTIMITSNTYWSCKSEGNFKLSKYDGNGDDIIDVIIPENIMTAEGTVIFSFGDERCFYVELDIYLTNDCLIITEPSYTLCNENEKSIFFYYEDKGEAFYVNVKCFNEWTVESDDLSFITNDEEIMIISSGEDGEVKIIPSNCEENNIIHVKLIKK